jgi:hypothetical protein
MNALLNQIQDTFNQAQGKRVNAQGIYVTVLSVEHMRHNAGSARLINRNWSDDLAHDEIIVTFESKFGRTQLVFTAFDNKDDVKGGHFQNDVLHFFGKVIDEDDIDVKGWSIEHVAIAQ